MGPRDLGLELIYDVAHNIAKIEEHEVNGKQRKLCVHRKGATRAFPAGPPGDARGLSADGPAGAHPRGHGALLLCAGGNSKKP